MDTLEAISASIETTEEVRSIVSTMKSLAAASIQGYERVHRAVGDYEKTVALGLQILLRDRPAPAPAALPGNPVVIVIGSDHGLCGRFNDHIGTFATARLHKMTTPDRRPFLAVAGSRVAAQLAADGHPPDHVFALPHSTAGLTGTVRDMTFRINRWIQTGAACSVSVAFNQRGSHGGTAPRFQQVLPVSQIYLDELANRPWVSRSLPTYRMPRDELLLWLTGEHLFARLYRALAASLASENAARLIAMQSAERNIDDRHDALRAAYRHKRQQTITNELLDIIAGYEMSGQPPRDTED